MLCQRPHWMSKGKHRGTMNNRVAVNAAKATLIKGAVTYSSVALRGLAFIRCTYCHVQLEFVQVYNTVMTVSSILFVCNYILELLLVSRFLVQRKVAFPCYIWEIEMKDERVLDCCRRVSISLPGVHPLLQHNSIFTMRTVDGPNLLAVV